MPCEGRWRTSWPRPALSEPHSHQLLAETVKLPRDKKATVVKALDILERFARRQVETDGASSVDVAMEYYSTHGKALAARSACLRLTWCGGAQPVSS